MFAIVKFVEENDAPGIISTNWIEQSNSNSCLYPNVKSELQKNKLLVNRAEPTSEWTHCQIKLLKEFDSYPQAKNHLSEAELTSNLESDDEYCLKKRQRKERRITLPGEEDSSDEDDSIMLKKKTSRGYSPMTPIPPPPPPPPSINRTSYSNQSSSSPTSSSASTSTAPITPLTPLTPLQPLSIEIESPSFSPGTTTNEIQLKKNQELMWNVMAELINTTKKIDENVQKLILLVGDSTNSRRSDEADDLEKMILPHLPLTVEELEKFEAVMDEKNKNKLVKYFSTINGKDVKSLTANLMRSMFVDEVGEKYSLTGKASKDGKEKKPLKNTKMFQVLIEVCQRKFKNAEASIIRGAVSDWLMQGKFRKARREQRKNKNAADD